MEPVFLDLEDVLAIHADQIERYGGSAGLRDMSLLQSALAAPRAGIGGVYFHSDPYEMAAAYLFHLARNHPFADGNKRTAALGAFVFLDLNGIELTASNTAHEKLVRGVATGAVSKAEAAVFFRKHSRPSD